MGRVMEKRDLEQLLAEVASGALPVDEAATRLTIEPYSDLSFAKVDHHRGIRQGVSEVIYGEGKTPDQIAGIVASMLDAGQERVLITRLDAQPAQELQQLLADGLVLEGVSGEDADERREERADGKVEDETSDEASDLVPELPVFTYYDLPRIATIGEAPEPDGAGYIVVACGGTSDLPVAEEAAITAEALGNKVVRLYDVGVSGIHRLLANMEPIMTARCIVAVAGMEGALPSVIGGLADVPVIAVPTSVGYGASLGGVAALLSMLNSCASGVSVVNIDNGFGGGYLAHIINHLGKKA